MPTATLTENERAAQGTTAPAEPEDETLLRALALEQIRRVRKFKLHALVFLVGVPALGGIWVLTEYFEEHTWPSRFADAPDVAGTWSPWFFWAAGIWLCVLAIHAVRTYLGPFIRRPPTTTEIDREVERLKARG